MLSDTSVLIEFVSSLNRQTDYTEILRIVAIKVNELLDADNTLIMMINPGTQETIKTIFREDRGLSNRIDYAQHQITGWMLKQNASLISKDLSQDDRFYKLNESIFKLSVIATIIQTENIYLGALIVFRKKQSSPFKNDSLELLEYMTAVASPYLRNIKKIREYFLPGISQNALLHKYAETGLIGESEKFVELLNAIDTASRNDVRVVLEGESGTGKELIANAIHKFSDRRDKAFIAIDCGTLPSHLIESELFGHKKGAFTGATFERNGLIEEAHQGTLFIDEISNLPFELQSKFLRFLQEGEIRPLGSNKSIKVNVRIITASSASLSDMVDIGKFRQDLYFRLLVYPIYVPTLRERQNDIMVLSEYFLKKFSKIHKKRLEQIDPKLISFLQKHKFDGNVRELQNLIERLVALADQDERILDRKKLPNSFLKNIETDNLKSNNMKKTLKDQLIMSEKSIIETALEEYNWNQSAAARSLDISESMIRYRMRKLGIIGKTRLK